MNNQCMEKSNPQKMKTKSPRWLRHISFLYARDYLQGCPDINTPGFAARVVLVPQYSELCLQKYGHILLSPF